MVIAITILAIISVLGWRSLDGIVRARIALTSETEAMRNLQLLFSQLQHDCPLIESLGAGEPRIVAYRNTVTFVRAVYEENQASRRQVVSYRLRDRIISRSASVPTRDAAKLLVDWQAAKSEADLVSSVPLFSDVEAMPIHIWFNGNTDWMNANDFPPGGPMMNEIMGLKITVNFRNNEKGVVKTFLLGAQ